MQKIGTYRWRGFAGCMSRLAQQASTLAMVLVAICGVLGCQSGGNTPSSPVIQAKPAASTGTQAAAGPDAIGQVVADIDATAPVLLTDAATDLYSRWQQVLPLLVDVSFGSSSEQQRMVAWALLAGLIDTAVDPDLVSRKLQTYFEQGDDTEKIRVLQLFQAMGPHASPSVPWLIRQVRSHGPYHQIEAIQALGEIGRRQTVVPELLRLYRTSDSQNVRVACLRTLGTLGVREIIADLVKHLQSRDTSLQIVAAEALGNIGNESPAVLTGLRKLAQDPDASVRAESIASLGKLGAATEDVVAAVATGLEDDSPEVRKAALVSVGRLRVANEKMLLRICRIADEAKTDPKTRTQVLKTLSLLDRPSRDRLARLFADGKVSEASLLVARALAISSADGVKFLTEIIEGGHPGALPATIALSEARAFPELVAEGAAKAIQLQEPFLRFAIDSALSAEAMSPALLKVVGERVVDESAETRVRLKGIALLDELGGTDPLAVKVLRTARRSENDEVARRAAAALQDENNQQAN